MDRVLPLHQQEGQYEYGAEPQVGAAAKDLLGLHPKGEDSDEVQGEIPLDGVVELDGAFVGGQESARERGNQKKRMVVFAIERKGKEVSRLYGKAIPSGHAKHPGEFMEETVAITAKIRTDGRTGHGPLKAKFKGSEQGGSKPQGSNFKEMHRIIM